MTTTHSAPLAPLARRAALALAALGAALAAAPAAAQVYVQCKGDLDGDAVPDPLTAAGTPNPDFDPNVVCKHLAAGDGFVRLSDGREIYTFGFSDVTGLPEATVMNTGMLAAGFPAPPLALEEGQEFYLTLSNVGMVMRPDLFDPHSVHWHGMPNAAPVFDGLPESGITINMGASLTYYYRVPRPGTYLYHCHVEATEHMQMGMLGSLWVRPRQDRLPDGTVLAGGFVHRAGQRYAYNDGDGSTRYDVEAALQLSGFDRKFHDASETVQPLPFSTMKDTYSMINGRGYPDTVVPAALAAPTKNGGKTSQHVHSLVEARQGERILLRLSNLTVTRIHTVATTGLPMRLVGLNAALLRGPPPARRSLYRDVASLTLGGGESADVIVDTAGVPPGTYFLYASNLHLLSSETEDLGGMMTEIRVLAP